MTTQANIVEITRFEAFALYKHYKAKAEVAKERDYWYMVESLKEDAQKWLDIAAEIESTDADGINKNLVIG